jgi:hypothetical protein
MDKIVVFTSKCVFCDIVLRLEAREPVDRAEVVKGLQEAVLKHLDVHVEEMIEVAHGTHN